MLDDPGVNLIQFTEGLFPADSTFTFDVEARVREADIADGHALERFVIEYLRTRVAPAEAVLVCLGVRLGAARDLEGALAVDREADSIHATADDQDASRRRGHQTLQLAVRLTDNPLLLGLSVRAEAGTTPCHHALVFGVVGGVLGWSARATVEAYLQATAAMIIETARHVRPFAPSAGRSVLWSLDEEIAELATRATAAEALAVWSCALSAEPTLTH